MLSLVDVVLALLLFGAFQLGRRRGFAWQFAGLASLILGGMAARRFGPRLAAAFGAAEGLRSILAWAAIYAGTAALVHILVARWRAWLQKKDLEELDSHLGGWIGAFKGAVILAVILLFAMTLSEGVTQLVLRSVSGRVLGRLAPLVQDYLPPETSRRLAPHIPEVQAPPPAPPGPDRGQPPGVSRPSSSGGPKNTAPPRSQALETPPAQPPSKPPTKALSRTPEPPAPSRLENGSEGDHEGLGGESQSGQGATRAQDPFEYRPLRPLEAPPR